MTTASTTTAPGTTTTRTATGPARTARAVAPAPGGGQLRAWVEQIMGMPISVHVRGRRARGVEADAAVRAAHADLRTADARFSTYRSDSEICRLQRGELPLAGCSADVHEVERLCRDARDRTDGWFDAWNCVPGRPGMFDPTGLVKSWAVARAARRLAPLTAAGMSWAVNAGGDVLVRNAAGDAEAWVVGIEDPFDRSRVLATVPMVDGAVATSGLAARGAHIQVPGSGRAAREVMAATVVGPSLLWADVWATALVARGREGIAATAGLHGTTGIVVTNDGVVHRWANDP